GRQTSSWTYRLLANETDTLRAPYFRSARIHRQRFQHRGHREDRCVKSFYTNYPSKMTSARAVFPVCVMVRAMFLTPRLVAIAHDSPDKFSVGLPPGSRTTSISPQRTPRAQP